MANSERSSSEPWHGVFLDAGSVDGGDLDRSRLEQSLSAWHWHEHTAPTQRAARLAVADVVVSNKCLLDEATLAGASRLKLVVVAATGTNNVDLQAAAARHITVCNCRDYASESVAQHTITLMLNLLSGQPEYLDRVRAGDWSRARHFSLFDRPIRELAGLKLGIVGHGVLGQAVAGKARALGMIVLVAARPGKTPGPGRLAFEDVVSGSDVLSLHCPLTEETLNLVDRRVMSSMKQDAVLINTARGGIVNETDLADCLREGILAGAGVDTLSLEPPPEDHPLLASDIPNLLLTPHNAWASRTSRQALLDQVADIVHAFGRGAPFNRV